MAEEDLIFGKNRHFFGGIEPSNMKTFSASLNETSGKVKLTNILPDDTVINGQTLCTIAGAIIRRKLTNYPADEFDGDFIADLKGSATIVDVNTVDTGTYYYSAFPYTTQGVYNRNRANRAVINEPANMVTFAAKSVYNPTTETMSVQLTAEIPTGVVGAVIRKSINGYPVDENDGEVFRTITSDETITDTDVTIGVIYYYSAFPYISTGAYNRNPENRTSVEVSGYAYLYGYDIDLTDSNPHTRVTYPSDVDNADFTAAKMNFTNSRFDYGDWPSQAGDKFMPKPCMLTYAGVVDHYLDQDNYAKKDDGTTNSSVASTAFGGNAMMEWPKIYTKRWTENGVYKFRCCDIKLDDTWECYTNYDRQNNEIDHFYTPIYFGSSVSSKMRSISGQSNYVSNTADSEINLAKANGADWYTEVVADRLLIQDLLVLMAKSTDCQTAFGYGRCNSSSALGQGTMNTKGLFWGDDDQTSGVKVFGMENWWGNIWRRTAGWMLVNGTQKLKLTRGTHDDSTATDYNTTGNGYLSVAGATPEGSSGGYIKTTKNEAYGRIPFDTSGSSTTYEADGLYYNNSGIMYALVGGVWSGGLLVGPFCAFLYNAPSLTASFFGAALSCKPLA